MSSELRIPNPAYEVRAADSESKLRMANPTSGFQIRISDSEYTFRIPNSISRFAIRCWDSLANSPSVFDVPLNLLAMSSEVRSPNPLYSYYGSGNRTTNPRCGPGIRTPDSRFRCRISHSDYTCRVHKPTFGLNHLAIANSSSPLHLYLS